MLIATQEDQKGDDDQHSQHKRDRAYRSGEPMHVVTQEVAPQPVEGRPDDAPCGIEEQKAGPAHTVGPGQEGCPGAEHGDKASEEDDFAAMPHEEVLPQFQPALLQTNVATIAPQQTVPTLAPDPEAQIITQDRPTGRRRDYHWNEEL